MNRDIAARLGEAAWLLRDQGADPYRVNACRRAAATVRRWPHSLDVVLRERGLDGLEELPGVGTGIRAPIGPRRRETGWFWMSRDPGASDSARC